MNIWKVGGDDRPFLPAAALPNCAFSSSSFSLAPNLQCRILSDIELVKMENEDSQKKCSEKKLHPNQEFLTMKKMWEMHPAAWVYLPSKAWLVGWKNSQYSSGHGSLRPRQFFDELYWPSYYSLRLLLQCKNEEWHGKRNDTRAWLMACVCVD